jgi:hypothetical protein
MSVKKMHEWEKNFVLKVRMCTSSFITPEQEEDIEVLATYSSRKCG